MEDTIIIYTDTQGRVYYSQNEDNTLTQHKVTELPPIPEEPLKDGYLIYIDDVFSFGYEINANKCYGAINDQKAKLSDLDYLFNKKAMGCDMTKYGNWEERVRDCRDEIDRIQELLTPTNQ